MTCGVGRIVCVPTGEGYVFSSVNCELYYRNCIAAGRKGELYAFQDAFDEHGGPKNFRLEILVECSPREMTEIKERYLDEVTGSELNTARAKKSRLGERRALMLAKKGVVSLARKQ